MRCCARPKHLEAEFAGDVQGKTGIASLMQDQGGGG